MGAPTKANVDELFRIDRQFARQAAREAAAEFDDVRTWVDPNGYRLSDRVWNARTQVREQIDVVLRDAVANRTDALVVAKQLEQYLNPAYAIARGPDGRVLKNQPRGIVTTAPGRGGQGSYPARRLARTEISRAHAQATQKAASLTPFAVGWKWHTSASHPAPDECDDNASRDDGLGPGVYPPEGGPRMPAHPNCLCYSTIETRKDVDKVVEELRVQYDLGPTTEPVVGPAPSGQRIPFVPAKNVDDAIARAKKYNVEFVDPGRVDVDIVNHLGPTWEDLHARGAMPDRPLKIDFTSSGQTRRPFAVYDGNRDILEINLEFKDMWAGREDISKSIELIRGKPYFASRDAGEAFVHELGHVHHFRNDVQFFESLRFNEIPGDLGFKVFDDVSGYATANPYEYVAEMYMRQVRGDTFPDDLMALYQKWGGPDVPRTQAIGAPIDDLARIAPKPSTTTEVVRDLRRFDPDLSLKTGQKVAREVDEETYGRVVGALEDVREKYPEYQFRVKFGHDDFKFPAAEGKTIEIDFVNVQRFAEKSKGFDPLDYVDFDPRAYSVYHEFGHVAHGYRQFGDPEGLLLRKIPLDPTEQAIARRVSEYASNASTEFIADTFAKTAMGQRFDDEVYALYRKLDGPDLTPFLRSSNIGAPIDDLILGRIPTTIDEFTSLNLQGAVTTSGDLSKGKRFLEAIRTDLRKRADPDAVDAIYAKKRKELAAEYRRWLKASKAGGGDQIERATKLAEERAQKALERRAARATRKAKKQAARPGESEFMTGARQRIADGIHTEADVQELGELLEKEIERRIGSGVDRATQIRDEIQEIRTRVAASGRPIPIPDERRIKALKEELQDIEVFGKGAKGAASYADRREAIRDVIADIRDVKRTPSSKPALNAIGAVNTQAARILDEAFDLFPADWVEDAAASLKRAGEGYRVRVTERGKFDYYNRTIELSRGSDADKHLTSVHEIGHFFERYRPNLVRLEREFFERRTVGEIAVDLGGSMKGEYSKLDKWTNRYMGKEYGYGDEKAYEIFTMGVDSLLSNGGRYGHHPRNDPEFYRFILGILGGI